MIRFLIHNNIHLFHLGQQQQKTFISISCCRWQDFLFKFPYIASWLILFRLFLFSLAEAKSFFPHFFNKHFKIQCLIRLFKELGLVAVRCAVLGKRFGLTTDTSSQLSYLFIDVVVSIFIILLIERSVQLLILRTGPLRNLIGIHNANLSVVNELWTLAFHALFCLSSIRRVECYWITRGEKK